MAPSRKSEQLRAQLAQLHRQMETHRQREETIPIQNRAALRRDLGAIETATAKQSTGRMADRHRMGEEANEDVKPSEMGALAADGCIAPKGNNALFLQLLARLTIHGRPRCSARAQNQNDER